VHFLAREKPSGASDVDPPPNDIVATAVLLRGHCEGKLPFRNPPGRLGRDKQRSGQEVGFVLQVSIPITAASMIERRGCGVQQKPMAALVGDAVGDPARIMSVVVYDAADCPSQYRQGGYGVTFGSCQYGNGPARVPNRSNRRLGWTWSALGYPSGRQGSMDLVVRTR
jgi:hypothetical protein